VFALSLTGFFHIIYFIAFFAFDTMYSLVAWISMRYKVYKISAVPLANTNQVTVNGRRNLATI
jgi:hypothetical protein